MIDYSRIIKTKLSRLSKIDIREGFRVFTSFDPDFADKKPSSAVFPNFFILDSFKSLKSYPEIKPVIERLTSFLVSQGNDRLCFNYWRRNSEAAASVPYPDDLDSTSMAFASLDLLNGENDGEALAYLIMILSSEEAFEGGPYYTWITLPDAEKWKDVDLAVNANIAYALSKVGAELPNLVGFMESAIEMGSFSSRYYETEFSVAYFVSRAYRGEKIGDLKIWFEKNIDKAANPLDLSFSVLGLMNCGVDSSNLSLYVEKIANWLDSESGNIYPFVVETNRNGVKSYSGSYDLELALALEVINRAGSSGAEVSRDDSYLVGILSKVKSDIEADLDDCGGLRKSFSRWFEAVSSGKEKQEIILVASLLASGLPSDSRKGISDEFLVSLGVVSLCGWIAYSIYDGFLDGEGNPADLPLANYCLRKVVSELKSSSSDDFFGLSLSILNKMDAGNLWEIEAARIENSPLEERYGKIYSRLDIIADKSMGHSLGPTILLSKLGYAVGSVEIASVLGFFKNYIIARQLNDDLRDCFEDLAKGRISPVVALLTDAIAKRGIDLKDEVEINKIFWNDVLPLVCKLALEYSASAVAAAGNLSHLGDVSVILSRIIAPVRLATERTLADRKTYLQFTKTCG